MGALEVLGLRPGATEEEIRTAYVNKVREYPPDREPAEFERIRDAYETLRDPRKRALAMLLADELAGPLASIADGLPTRRLFAGPQAWREVLRAK